MAPVRMTAGRDSRRSRRKQLDYVGLLDYCDGEEPRPCQIQDISAGGAHLMVFTETETIPETLTLLLSPSAKVRRDCKVVSLCTRELGLLLKARGGSPHS